MPTAGFTDYEAMLDGLAPYPPNGDLVAYDTYEQTERSLPNLFTEFVSTLWQPVAEPMSQWFEQTTTGPS